MSSDGQDFSMHQGVHRVLAFSLSGADAGEAAAIKWVLADADGSALVTRTLANGGVANVTPAGFEVLLYPSDTSSIPPGEYAHEARVTNASGQQDVVASGTATIRASVTR